MKKGVVFYCVSCVSLVYFIGCASSMSQIWQVNPYRQHYEYFKPPAQISGGYMAATIIQNMQPNISVQGRGISEVAVDATAVKFKQKWSETVVDETQGKSKIYTGFFDIWGTDVNTVSHTQRQVDKEGMVILPLYEMNKMALVGDTLVVGLKNGNTVSIAAGNQYDIKKIADALYSLLRSKGYDLKAGFGLECADISPDQGRSIGVPDGMVINYAVPGGPGQASNLRMFDIIQKINGRPVYDGITYNTMETNARRGVPYNFEVIRWEGYGESLKKQSLNVRVIAY